MFFVLKVPDYESAMLIYLYPMGKNFRNRYATVVFFMRSVPILTPTNVNKRQFLKSYTILIYNSHKIVVFMPVGYRYRYPTKALQIAPT